MSDGTQRRLAAIVSADVVGYSRLMGVDEASTLAVMRAHRAELWNPTIEQFGGRVVSTAGDSMLIEFASAVAAVESSIAVQNGMAERNADLPDGQRMLLRIGVNVGEVIVDGGDIFGDGVNVAARLQEFAEPGGVCLSVDAYRQVRNRLELTFEEMGEQQFKNISEPVGVFCVRFDAGSGSKIRVGAEADRSPVVFTKRPAVAVLPFHNLTDDPHQEYFASGVAEDIITALSCWRTFPVIARSSSFAYRERPMSIKQVGHALGASYVLDGSVRRIGARVKVTVQLIDAAAEYELWADRFDGDMSDIFSIQDEITERVVAAVEPEIFRIEQRKVTRKHPENMDAWDYCLRGWWHLWQLTLEELKKAQGWLEKSIALDPNFALACTSLSVCLFLKNQLGMQGVDSASFKQAEALARKAIKLDDADALAHHILGVTASHKGDHAAGASLQRRALNLNPSLVYAYHGLGVCLIYSGQPDEGLRSVETAIRLSPRDFMLPMWKMDIAAGQWVLGQHQESLATLSEVLTERPRWTAALALKSCNLAALGEDAAAKSVYEEVKRIKPNFQVARLEGIFQFDQTQFRRLTDGLRRVGWE